MNFRKSDVVRIRRDLTEERKERLKRFVRKQGFTKLSLELIFDRNCLFKIKFVSFTVKNKVPFASLQLLNFKSIQDVAVPTRYLKFLERTPSHPLTGIFV